MGQIVKNSVVKIKKEFIQKFNRTELVPSDSWKVIRVDVICNGFIAKLEHIQTRERIDINTRNLTIEDQH